MTQPLVASSNFIQKNRRTDSQQEWGTNFKAFQYAGLKPILRKTKKERLKLQNIFFDAQLCI
jgi:hypothetical protein